MQMRFTVILKGIYVTELLSLQILNIIVKILLLFCNLSKDYRKGKSRKINRNGAKIAQLKMN